MKNDERKRGDDNIGSSVSFNPYVLTFLCIKLRGYRSIRDRCSFFFLLPPFPARRSSFITILWHVSRSVTMFDRLFTTSSWDERELVFSGCERPCRSLQCREIVSFIFLPLAIIVYTTVLMYLESSRFGDFRGLDFEGDKKG